MNWYPSVGPTSSSGFMRSADQNLGKFHEYLAVALHDRKHFSVSAYLSVAHELASLKVERAVLQSDEVLSFLQTFTSQMMALPTNIKPVPCSTFVDNKATQMLTIRKTPDTSSTQSI